MNFSERLFLGEDGGPMRFFMPPSEERRRLRPLIQHGGGQIARYDDGNCIRLVAPGFKSSGKNCVLSTYIDACIKNNRLLYLEEYRVGESDMESDDSMADVFDLLDDLQQTSGSRYTRKKYLLGDDMAIIKYLLQPTNSKIRGRKLWEKMAADKVTSHSSQSMKSRFLKTIWPNINSYSLDERELLDLASKCSNEKQDDDVNAQSADDKVSMKDETGTSSPSKRSRTSKISEDTEELDEFDRLMLLQAETRLASTPVKKKPASSRTERGVKSLGNNSPGDTGSIKASSDKTVDENGGKGGRGLLELRVELKRNEWNLKNAQSSVKNSPINSRSDENWVRGRTRRETKEAAKKDDDTGTQATTVGTVVAEQCHEEKSDEHSQQSEDDSLKKEKKTKRKKHNQRSDDSEHEQISEDRKTEDRVTNEDSVRQVGMDEDVSISVKNKKTKKITVAHHISSVEEAPDRRQTRSQRLLEARQPSPSPRQESPNRLSPKPTTSKIDASIAKIRSPKKRGHSMKDADNPSLQDDAATDVVSPSSKRARCEDDSKKSEKVNTSLSVIHGSTSLNRSQPSSHRDCNIGSDSKAVTSDSETQANTSRSSMEDVISPADSSDKTDIIDDLSDEKAETSPAKRKSPCRSPLPAASGPSGDGEEMMSGAALPECKLQAVKDVCEWLNLSVSEFGPILHAASGDLKLAVHWVFNGSDYKGANLWSPLDDDFLREESKKSDLIDKYSAASVERRLKYLMLS